jgi:SAM-dependent methyltransferase
VCGACDPEPVYQQRFAVEDDGRRIASYSVVVCRPCGAVYADGIPSQAELEAYYRESSRYEYLESEGAPPAWLTQWHRAVVESLLPHLRSPHAKIVDVGCANGDVLGMLKAAGYERVLGVDPAPGSPEAALRLHGVRVVTGDIMRLPEETRDADCVLLAAVLEHLRDVGDGFASVAGTLAPDGLIYVEVPDLERFPTQVVPPFQQFSVEHVNYFTVTSLDAAAARAGMTSLAHWTAVRWVGPSAEPSLCALYRRSASSPLPRVRDASGEVAVRAYVAACSARESEVATRVEEIVTAGTPLIVWGVGSHTLHLLESTSLGRANIVALVDANPRLHGMAVNGMLVTGPESVASRPEALLICSPLRHEDIVRMARERFHMSNPVLTLYPSPLVADGGKAGRPGEGGTP